MKIEFAKKPTYTVDGQSFETLEEAQEHAIYKLDEAGFSLGVAKQILNNAKPLMEIFKQAPRVRAGKTKRTRKPSTPTT